MRKRIARVVYRSIGVIRSPFMQPRGTPIQAVSGENVEGTVEVFPQYLEGLEDLEGFSHIILIYHFHMCKGFSLRVRPFLDDPLHGIFATRAPARPNSIGISIVRLLRVKGGKLHIQGVDIVDGTPLLDIKPYVPEFDWRKVERVGWLEGNLDRLHKMRDDGRFTDARSVEVEHKYELDLKVEEEREPPSCLVCKRPMRLTKTNPGFVTYRCDECRMSQFFVE